MVEIGRRTGKPKTDSLTAPSDKPVPKRQSVPGAEPKSQSAPSDVSARIYVVGNPRHLDTAVEGSRTWWCIERSSVAGEIAAVYVKQKGFRFLFRVVDPCASSQVLCKDHALGTGEVEILRNRPKPLSTQDLRAHRILRGLPALKRSFQRKSFRLEEPFLSALLDAMRQG